MRSQLCIQRAIPVELGAIPAECYAIAHRHKKRPVAMTSLLRARLEREILAQINASEWYAPRDHLPIAP